MPKHNTFVSHICLGLLLLISYTLFRAHTFAGELVHDDGLFLYAGQAWANGQLPYRDFWDHKPPGIFFVLSIPLRIFPFSILATKLFEVIWLSLTAYFLFFLVRKLFSPLAALIVLPFFLLFTSHPYTIRSGGLTEEFALLFVILSYLQILKEPLKTSSIIFSGVLLGLAVQFRQTFIFETLFPIGIILHAFGYKNWPSSIKQVLLLGVGIIIPEIIISLYFLFHGAWFAYYEASYLANFYYVGAGGADRSFLDLVALQWEFILKTGPYLLAPFFALISFFFMPKTKRFYLWPLLFTFIGDVIAISLSGEYYEHYYVQAAVTICLLIAFFMESVIHVYTKLIVQRQSQYSFFLLQPILFVFLIFSLIGFNSFLADYKNAYFDSSSPSMDYRFQTSVANAVHSITKPDDTVLLIGRTPNSVYILSHRYAGSRYYHYSPLWKEKFEGKNEQRHQTNFINDLKTKKPALLLIDLTRLRGEPLSRIKNNVPEALPYIQENYIVISELNASIPEDWFWYDTRLELYIRKDNKDIILEQIQKMNSMSSN